MTSGATPAPQTEQPDPSIDERSGDVPQKPTNSPELGRELLSDRPNKGPLPELSVLPVPRPMAMKGRPKKASPRGLGPTIEPLEKRGALGDHMAPSQSPNALGHPTHNRL
jgi:hypothetical protein